MYLVSENIKHVLKVKPDNTQIVCNSWNINLSIDIGHRKWNTYFMHFICYLLIKIYFKYKTDIYRVLDLGCFESKYFKDNREGQKRLKILSHILRLNGSVITFT